MWEMSGPMVTYSSPYRALVSDSLLASGGLFALQTTYLDPAQFGILESVRLIAIAVIGGLLNPLGPAIGAAVFVLLPELMGAFGRAMSLVFSLLLGTIAFMGSLAFGVQRYFEYQIEEARKISQPQDD